MKVAIVGIILVFYAMLIAIIILLQKKPEPEPKIVVIEEKEIPVLETTPNCEYRQTGIITSSESDKEPIILPLFSRNVYGRHDRFQYYTMTDKQHMIHLPVQFQNRQCEERIGCEELYTGDKITVTSYENREFTVTIYKRY
jgi:hypothetical protein